MSVLITGSFVADSSSIEIPEPLFRQLRRADEFIRLGVVAAYNVLQQNGGLRADGERTGLFLGTAFGPMQTNFDVLDQVVENEPVSPTLFSHSVFNAAAGYIASVLGIHGCAITLTDFGFPFFSALEQGMVAIESGHLDSCLILQVETYSDLLLDAKKAMVPAGEEWFPGAVCWLLEKEDIGAGLLLEKLEIASRTVNGKAILQLQEQVQLDGKPVAVMPGYLGAASCLGRELDTTNPLLISVIEIESEYGTVAMDIRGV
ncbi:beta-ketoacyl synthase N-terminal-like domain-containing protein [Desulfopila sp. IMCC35008]|uniref:beta-ketoacyl synthase N-terminal-like domain-containing protein n=1 Tax=Desulfopila sp. IMCC35008 TaxID=2653858 RepID=UPI0013D7E404|nr:beta-ketoacyl synthase N-terminal-like domain-containing protein [Desulfopila sp. IMCC35008]